MSEHFESLPLSPELQRHTLRDWVEQRAPKQYLYNHRGEAEFTQAHSATSHILLQRSNAEVGYKRWFLGFFPQARDYSQAIKEYKELWAEGIQANLGLDLVFELPKIPSPLELLYDCDEAELLDYLISKGAACTEAIAQIKNAWTLKYVADFAQQQIGLPGIVSFKQLLDIAADVDRSRNVE